MFRIPDSIETASWLSINEKSALRALAAHCGRTNTCWPSVERIGRFMNRQCRTVQRTLKRLLELKLISIMERPGKTHLFKVLCLEERRPINTPATVPTDEQTRRDLNTNVRDKRLEKFVSPREISVLLADLEEVVGTETATRNRAWFIRIIRACGWDLIQAGIQALRSRMLEAMITDDVVRSPSAWLTWYLRHSGGLI